jgi:hypothetical protein
MDLVDASVQTPPDDRAIQREHAVVAAADNLAIEQEIHRASANSFAQRDLPRFGPSDHAS